MQTALAGHRAFFIRREAFDVPDRQKEVGKRERHSAEHCAHDARPALGSIQMHDVRELVGEDDPQPIVGMPDEVRSRRPCGCDDDRVAGERHGVAIRKLGLIDQDDVRERRRLRAERPLQCVPRFLGNRCETRGQTILALMKIDHEVVGWQDAEAINRIEKR